jgi:N-acetylglucosaminyldiphosphoundecaprenol N-acetyl-beta-D-mannosaminyltransferase
MKNKKNKILNINITKSKLRSVINNVVRSIDSGKKFYICTVNAFQVVKANEDDEFLRVLNSADTVIPDGMPIVWYSKLIKKPLHERISGYEFFYTFSKVANNKKYSYFFFGGKNYEVLDLVKKRINKEFRNIEVKGMISPPIMEKFPQKLDTNIINSINKCKPDVLWVGLSAPKQEKWIYKNIEKLDIKMAFGIGAAFNFYSGMVKRAPLWMQRAGFEWLFRVFVEPKRLFKKYLVNNTKFIMLIIRDIFRRASWKID